MSVSQMREFVKKFGQAQQEHQSLKTHTAIADKLLEFTNSSSFRKRLSAEQSKNKKKKYDTKKFEIKQQSNNK